MQIPPNPLGRLTLVIECPTVDQTTNDPHDVAEEVVAIYNKWAEANGEATVEFVAAEWGYRMESDQ